MVGLVQLKHVGPASYVWFGSGLSCPWRISHWISVEPVANLTNASTAAVEDVTARIIVRTSRSRHKFLKSRTMTLKILLASLLIAATTSFVLSSSEDHHGIPSRSHRIVWPVWYRDRQPHASHDRPDDKHLVRETTTPRGPWTPRPQVSTTRSPQQINSASRHAEQRILEQKFNGAVAMVENSGTRAIAYAGYHGSHHQHHLRETDTQGFQLITTTVPTFTRHHSG